MGKTAPDQPPEMVIAWLRTPAGEQWSYERVGRIARHHDYSGVFADVLPEDCGGGRKARWPEPFNYLDLDSEGN
jgi:hypothetical protein